MRKVSVFFLDEVNNAKGTLMAISILLKGLSRACDDLDELYGLKEALSLLSEISESEARSLDNKSKEEKGG